jgi:hypothetical protein
MGEIRKMASAIEMESTERSGRWQLSLADLIFIVLAAGSSRDAWRSRRSIRPGLMGFG